MHRTSSIRATDATDYILIFTKYKPDQKKKLFLFSTSVVYLNKLLFKIPFDLVIISAKKSNENALFINENAANILFMSFKVRYGDNFVLILYT